MANLLKHSSTSETRDFYQGLVEGDNKRGLWGLENRFDPNSISSNPSVHKHFVPVVARYLNKNDVCLDLGCGPGGFLSLMAPLCKSIVGADIVPAFVETCQAMIDQSQLTNASAALLEKGKLPFADGQFDKVIMIDTIHHLEEHDKTMEEVKRVLKPGGLYLIFEPNKLNPLLALLCLLDKNEHGLLKLGTFASYRKLLGDAFTVEEEIYNGVLIGPKSKAALAVADYVSSPRHRAFGWFSPKLFIAARKKGR